ncbi:chorismate synthase [Peptoniphilaceae bacterium SGI.131]
MELNNLILDIWGSSHGDRIGFKLFGLETGANIDMSLVEEFLSRRSSVNKAYATARKEKDILNISGGFEGGLTTSKPVEGYFINKDVDSKAYEKFNQVYRPSHVDYVSKLKFGRNFDIAGSSVFSGRLSVAVVAAGAMANSILRDKGIYVKSHIKRLGEIEDRAVNYEAVGLEDFADIDPDFSFLDKSRLGELEVLMQGLVKEKDSLGGQVELAIFGNVEKLGGPYFDRLEARLARLVFSTPGVRALEFGRGIRASYVKGSENNDPFILRGGKVGTKTNNSGGINGGIANGMPIIINAFVKPTASIGKKQLSLDLSTGKETCLELGGRHDPAFILRIPPVLEAMVSLAVLDLYYEENKLPLRNRIDIIDEKIARLFVERSKLTRKIGRIKAIKNQPIDVPQREAEILDRLKEQHSDNEDLLSLYGEIFKISKEGQEKLRKTYSGKYGLAGKSLKHSYSPEIHKFLGGYDYSLFEVEEDELEDLIEGDRLGLNVTIPYKEKVIPYLDGLTKQAEAIGAVNLIQYNRGKKYGFNTDYYGFQKLIEGAKIEISGKNVLVLGTGASSKTVSYVLSRNRAKSINYVSRRGEVNYSNCYDFKDTNVIVNTSPVGMYPNADKCLLNLSRFENLEAVVDLIYNPLFTRFIIEGKKLGLKTAGGLPMLVYQAKKSVELFKNTRLDDSLAEENIDALGKEKLNIVLVGMPGSGKSTIGRKLARRLGKKFIDLDFEFKKVYGLTTSQAFEEYGEGRFRDMETELAKRVGSETGLVISTGGGIVVRRENYYSLKQNAYIIEIERQLGKLSTKNRPLSQGGIHVLEKLKADRDENYKYFADIQVRNDGYFNYAVDDIVKIVEKLKFQDLF